jgi:hypothetical protein
MNNQPTWTSQEHLFHGIWVYRNVFKKDLDILNRLENIGNLAQQEQDARYSWQEASVGYSTVNQGYRDCKDIKINEILNPVNNTQVEVLNLWRDLKYIQSGPALDYCNKYSIKMDYWEVMNCIKYGPGQHFKEHADHGFSYSATVSLVGYPNDDYEGGELTFPKLNLKIKPQAGDLYIFPSTYLFSHVAEPVQSGQKYSIVTMLDYNDHAHNDEFMQMRQRWVDQGR